MPTKQLSYMQGPRPKSLREALCPMRLGPHHQRHEDGNAEAPGVQYRIPNGSVWVTPEALIRNPAALDDLIVTGYTDIGGRSGEVWSQGSIRPEKGGELTYDKKPWFEGFSYPNLHGGNLEPNHMWERHFSLDGLSRALTSPSMPKLDVYVDDRITEVLPLRLYRQRRTVVLEMIAHVQHGRHVLMIFDFRSNSKEIAVYDIQFICEL